MEKVPSAFSEMTIASLKAQIAEIQQRIIELLGLLIQLIQQEIAAK